MSSPAYRTENLVSYSTNQLINHKNLDKPYFRLSCCCLLGTSSSQWPPFLSVLASTNLPPHFYWLPLYRAGRKSDRWAAAQVTGGLCGARVVTSLSIPYYRRIERMTALLRSLAGQSFQRPFTLFQIQPQTRKKPSSVHFVQLRVLSQDGNSFLFFFALIFQFLGRHGSKARKHLYEYSSPSSRWIENHGFDATA